MRGVNKMQQRDKGETMGSSYGVPEDSWDCFGSHIVLSTSENPALPSLAFCSNL